MRSRKASITLTINFLVTFIIAIVVFGMGLILAKQMFSGAGGLADKTFEDIDKQIGSLICSGSAKICFTAKQKRIERGAFGVFGLSVENVFSDEKDFEITIGPGTYMSPDQSGSSVHPSALGILPMGRTMTLAAKETDKMGIGIEVPKDALSGTYSFNVNIKYDDGRTMKEYDSPRKIYVKVP